MSRNGQKQGGISLVELMLGITIALIILAGILTVMLRISTSSASSVQSTRLNQQMRSTMDFVTKELQRAGYVNWQDAWGTGTGTHVFADLNGDGEVDVLDFYDEVLPVISRFGRVELQQHLATGTDFDCVLYSYDLNRDGRQGVGASPSGTVAVWQIDGSDAGFELFGIRHNANGVEVRAQLDNLADTWDCDSNGWSSITDDNVSIDRLNFSMTYATATGTGNDSALYQFLGGDLDTSLAASCSVSTGTTEGFDSGDEICLRRRSILVEMEGTLVSDPGVRLNLENRVKLKNDHMDSTP